MKENSSEAGTVNGVRNRQRTGHRSSMREPPRVQAPYLSREAELEETAVAVWLTSRPLVISQ